MLKLAKKTKKTILIHRFIYLTSAIIQIKVKTPKLISEALGKESSCGNVKSSCKKSSLHSFLKV